MDRRYLPYLATVLLGLAALVWIADQLYLRRLQSEPSGEAVAMAEILTGYCEANGCVSGRAPWPGLYFFSSIELALPEEEAEALSQGKLIRAISTGEHFYYLRSGELIAQLGPFDNLEPPRPGWHSKVFYVCLGMAILLCLLPLMRDLQGLAEAATQFAKDRNPQHFRFRHSRFFAPVSDAMVWMSQRLARSLALQKELSATLSHELRTPITRLKFAVASLPAGYDRGLQADLQQDLDELEQLVTEYLTFSRQEHERPLLDFAAVDLLEVITPNLPRLEAFTGKRIEVNAPTPVIARADKRSIQRAFNNLIENGIKFCHSQMRITLQSDDGEVAVVIEDDGPGLDGQELEDIFLPYMREAQANTVSGYGLGLAIVRKIVDWHGGRILAGASQTLGGARFELWLPTASTPKNEADDESAH